MMTITRHTFFPAILLFFYLPVSAQFKLTDPLPSDPHIRIGKLANGLTYYICKNAKPAKKVELRLAVNAGSVLEKNDQRGLAHFMEHMSFNGSKHFPKNELVDFLQKSGVKFGADLNAYTGFDETVYILPIPTDDAGMLTKGLTVLEDWAFNNLFDKNEIEKERGVVLEESRLSKGSYERMSRQYFPKLFNGSAYAERLPIGKDSILKTFDPAALQRFYKSWYRPNQMAVMVVGDTDPAVAEKLIISHFSKFSNPPAAPARPTIIPIAERTKPEAMVITDEEMTNTVVQVYNFVKPARKIKTWADYRKDIIETLVSTLINQRLQERTQQENPPFLFASTGFSEFIRGYNSFNSFAVLGKGTVQEAINALVEETNRARQFGFLQTELSRAKANLANEAEKSYAEKDKTESAGLVEQCVSNFLNGTPLPGITNRYRFVQQVLPGISLPEINAIANSMPSTARAFTLLEAPAAVKDKLPDSTQLLQALVTAGKIPVKAYEEKAVSSNLLDKDPVPGTTTELTTNQKIGTTNFTFSNGVTVTIKPTTIKNDEIKLDAWRPGGFHKFPLTDKENAQNAAILVQEMGVKDLSPTDLHKYMAGKTLAVQPYINENEEGIEGNSSVKDLETFLQLIYLYFTQPRKDESLFRSFISKQKASVEFISKNPQASYQDTLNKIIYNNDPWRETIPKASDYDNINADQSLAIYKQIFGNAYGMHFTFVGNIDPVKNKPLLEKYLAALPATPVQNSFRDVGTRMIKGPVDITIKRGKESQALINLFFEDTTTYNRDNRLQLAALIEALNIEIIEKLREDMSGMYGGGMGGDIVKRPYEHYIVRASIPCGPENLEKLSKALLDIIKNAQEKGVAQKDLDKVKQTWKKQYHVNLQSNDYWLETLSSAFINGDNPENILNYEQKIDAITVADLQKIAQRYLNTDKMITSVLYPENAAVKEEVKSGKKGF